MYSSLRIKRLRLKDLLSLSRYKDIFHFAIEMIEQTFELLLCQLPSEPTTSRGAPCAPKSMCRVPPRAGGRSCAGVLCIAISDDRGAESSADVVMVESLPVRF
jgi:hypothetical protein